MLYRRKHTNGVGGKATSEECGDGGLGARKEFYIRGIRDTRKFLDERKHLYTICKEKSIKSLHK